MIPLHYVRANTNFQNWHYLMKHWGQGEQGQFARRFCVFYAPGRRQALACRQRESAQLTSQGCSRAVYPAPSLLPWRTSARRALGCERTGRGGGAASGEEE